MLGSISSFLNRVLIGSNPSADGRRPELEEYIYALIYELHKISPDFLSKVIPNLTIQLQSDDEKVRSNVVNLMGKLFASQYADYATDFARCFR